MAQVTIYRFEIYDIRSDESMLSKRWGTRDAIARVHGTAIETSATEVDDSVLTDNGLTERDFNPNPRQGFQQTVEMTPRPY